MPHIPSRYERVLMERERRRRQQVVHASASWTDEGVVWKEDDRGIPQPFDAKGNRFSWAPQPGSQAAFLRSTHFEALYEGGRGIGKTDALLMDFAQYCGRGYGADWTGILFRRTHPELKDVKAKSLRWFPALFPGITYNKSSGEWRWPTGELLRFAHARTPEDYNSYHGHQYTWMGWEELTNWPNDELYTRMLSLIRSSNPNVPRHVRSTTNPHGVGHGWVKARWKLPVVIGLEKVVEEEGLKSRAAYHGHLTENRIFMAADPDYQATLRATKDPMRRKAWTEGDWNIVSGGMFDDLWNETYHVLPRITLAEIPKGWRVDRAYDHGTAAPFSTGWYAQSNGDPFEKTVKRRLPSGELAEVKLLIGRVRGDLIRFSEWYGSNGEPNQGLKYTSRRIGKGVVERDRKLTAGTSFHVRPGPADSAIWAGSQDDPEKSVASEMEAVGCEWLPVPKGAGSREIGWQVMRDMLDGAIPDDEGFRDAPGFFVTEDNEHFLRTVPVLPRSGDNPEDIDEEAEDHVADEVRYRCRAPKPELTGAERMRALS